MNSSFLYRAWRLYSLECTKEEFKCNTIILHVQSKIIYSRCNKHSLIHFCLNYYTRETMFLCLVLYKKCTFAR